MAKGRKRPASALSPSDEGESAQDESGGEGNNASIDPPAAPGSSKNEVRFGKHLACGDKKVRERTVSLLREWLHQRSVGGVLTDLDLLKIWRGLWYCMFMCDKAPVQRELAGNLAGLVRLFKEDRSEGVRFFRSFCITMQRDWERIDNLRIDKYYTLVRFSVREAILFCRQTPTSSVPRSSLGKGTGSPKAGEEKRKRPKKKASRSTATGDGEGGVAGENSVVWDLELLAGVVEAVEEEIVTPRMAPIGLRLHLADLWLEEVVAVGAEDMTTEALLILLAPWLRAVVSPETNAVVFKRTMDGVLEALLRHFPEDDAGGEEDDAMGLSGEVEDEVQMFKRAELVKVQACIFEAAAAEQTLEKRRKELYQLHRKYQKRTNVAPDLNAKPRGIISPPPKDATDSEAVSSDEEDQTRDDLSPEFGGPIPRAVRRPGESSVVGWAAAGVAAGAINAGDADGDDEEKGRASRPTTTGDRNSDGVKRNKKRSKREDESSDVEDADSAATPAVDPRSGKKVGKASREKENDTATRRDDDDSGDSSASKKPKKKKRNREPAGGVTNDSDSGSGPVAEQQCSEDAEQCGEGGAGESTAQKTRKKRDSGSVEIAVNGSDSASKSVPVAEEQRVENPEQGGETGGGKTTSNKKARKKSRRDSGAVEPGAVTESPEKKKMRKDGDIVMCADAVLDGAVLGTPQDGSEAGNANVKPAEGATPPGVGSGKKKKRKKKGKKGAADDGGDRAVVSEAVSDNTESMGNGVGSAAVGPSEGVTSAGAPEVASDNKSKKGRDKKAKPDSLDETAGKGAAGSETIASNAPKNDGTDGSVAGFVPGEETAPPGVASGKKKRKKGDKKGTTENGDGVVVGDAVPGTPQSKCEETGKVAVEAGGVVTPPGTGSSKNKSKKSKEKKAGGTEDDGVLSSPLVPVKDVGNVMAGNQGPTATPGTSSGKKKKKKRKSVSPVSEKVSAMAPPPPPAEVTDGNEADSGEFLTPTKKTGSGKKKRLDPGPCSSSKKTVTFGRNISKEHQKSIKDLKTCSITPAKEAGTPQKSLLKVGSFGSAVKAARPSGMLPGSGVRVPPASAPRRRKKAADFF